ncbi:hypothetical protein NX786_26125 [Telluria mixta]|uniref:Uncharacterized protein n=1 Tax=Telluria mixta TaxID=34071 RepID=A0ABT2C5Y4_9BURK|nr:hypothetical protein [Telluria mixta]MCS0632815.1 hypothetical protein [Telluria mixta]WEM97890.1 hypothetical protein P0M04_09275 [Telluria mixta]
MTWGIEFSSDRFLPTLPEGCQANPGVYGFELALWLAQALNRQGIVTGYPSAEDWGWCFDYAPADDLRLTIACASLCKADAGYDGRPIGWAVSIHEQRSLEQRLHNMSNHAALEDLGRQIVDLLRAEHIDAIHVRPVG